MYSHVPNQAHHIQVCICVIFFTIGLLANPTNGQDSVSTWQNAASGSFSDSLFWDTAFSPNNGNGGFSSHQAIIESTGSDYEIILGEETTLQSLTLNSSNATLTLEDDLTIQGLLDITNGTFRLARGQLIDGTVNGDILIDNNLSSNRLNGITLFGDIDMNSSDQRRLNFSNGLTHEGTIRLGSGTDLRFDGNNAITSTGSGSLIVANQVEIQTSGDSTLNFDSGVTLEGGVRILGSSDFTNDGTIIANNGLTILETRSLVNTGTIRVDTGAEINLLRWTSAAGTLHLNGGTMDLRDSFTIADLNQAGFIRNGGTLKLGGELLNSGTTLFTTESGGAAGQVGLLELAGGKITGGTVQGDLLVANDSEDNELSGVSLFGNIDLDSTDTRRLRISNDLIHGGSINMGSGSALIFIGETNTLQGSGLGSTIVANDAILDTLDSSVTFESNVTLRGSFSFFGRDFFNKGTIIAEHGVSNLPNEFPFLGFSLVNTGTIRVDSGAELNLGTRANNTGISWTSENGLLDVNGGTLNLRGSFATVGLNQPDFVRNGGTVNLQGTLINTDDTLFTTESSGASGQIGSLNIDGGTILGGTVRGDLLVTSDSENSLLEGVTLFGNLNMDSTLDRKLSIDGFTHEGLITLGSGAELTFVSPSDFQGTGTGSTITSVAGSTIVFSPPNSSVNVGPDVTIRGQLDVTGFASVNLAGKVVAESGVSNFRNLIRNTGVVAVESDAELSLGLFINNGIVDVGTDATLIFARAFEEGNNGGYQGDGLIKFEDDIFFESSNALSFDGDVELGTGATTFINLFSDLSTSSFDIGGDMNLDGDLQFFVLPEFEASLQDFQEFVIVEADGNLTGQFSNFAEGDVVGNFNGRDLFITYSSSAGNTVTLFSVVPEPGSALLISILMLAIAGKRKRQLAPSRCIV